MGNELFNSVVSKLSTKIPMFAKYLVTSALERMGTDPYRVSPLAMREAILKEIEPKLKKFTKSNVDVSLLGGGVITTDAAGEVICVSPGAKKLLSLDLPDAGRSPCKDETGVRKTSASTLEEELVGHGVLQPRETWTKKQKTFKFWEIDAPNNPSTRINIASGSFRSSQGEILGSVTFLQDITLRHALEDQVDELHRSMSREVEGRARQLEEITNKLKEKGDELERANRQLTQLTKALFKEKRRLSALDTQKNRLLFDVSHELRTPLVSVKGYTDLLLDGALGDLNDKQSKGLHVAKRNIDRLVHLIDELLDYSRLTSCSVTLSRQVTDLRPILGDAVALLEPRARKGQVKFISTLEPRPLPVYGDPARLSQVFVNLLDNAIKYNRPQGEVRVSVELLETNQKVQSKGGESQGGKPRSSKKESPSPSSDNREGSFSYLRVVIADTGEGIPEEEQRAVFDRFFRGSPHGTERARPKGIGLGLAITKTIVDLHHGAIQVRTPENGPGTVVWVDLPVCREESKRRFETEKGQPPKRSPAGSLKAVHPDESRSGGHILVVDDEPDILDYISLVLETHGYSVVTAKLGGRCLELARSQAPMAIFLDLGIQGVDGFEVLEARRRDPVLAPIPLCVVSAHVSDGTQKRVKEMGADAFLPKPFAPDRLLSVTREMLENDAG